LLLLAAVASVCGAQGNSPEPDRAAIAEAVQTCTAEGAFGYRFGEKDARPHDSAVAPFEIEGLAAQRDGLFEIAAAAWFGKAPMSEEDRYALSAWVYHALETQINARRHFAKRALHKDGVTYFSDADPSKGFALDLSHDGLRVRLACTDNALKKRAWKPVRGVGPESGQKLEDVESAQKPESPPPHTP
jgi:hypothetical protein